MLVYFIYDEDFLGNLKLRDLAYTKETAKATARGYYVDGYSLKELEEEDIMRVIPISPEQIYDIEEVGIYAINLPL